MAVATRVDNVPAAALLVGAGLKNPGLSDFQKRVNEYMASTQKKSARK